MAAASAPTEEDLPGRIRALADPLAAELEAELVEIEVRGARGSRVVRVVADADDGLDVDRIAALSQRIGARLDQEDLVDGSYTLEVTSPGVDRPLRTPREFRRNVGRDLRVIRSRTAIDRGEKGEVVGTLLAVDADVLELEVDGSGIAVPLDDVDYAKVVLPW